MLIHTGQHYDEEMSDIFFRELDIPEPALNLQVGSGPHGWQTGKMLIRLEEVFFERRPDWVLVYGDTNSTLAAALAAVKLHIPVAHVEAGLRSFNRAMPEEHNRILTDHASDLLLCPTHTSVGNLRAEGISLQRISLVGDVMYDAVLYNGGLAQRDSDILRRMNLSTGTYVLATVHRPRNTDDSERLAAILSALEKISAEDPVVFPAHPRTQKVMAEIDYTPTAGLQITDPVGYLDMLALEQGARLIITDSGGVQKEAYFFAVPCLTLRAETEWIETVHTGWNRLVNADPASIVANAHGFRPGGTPPRVFGDGCASQRIVDILLQESSPSRS